MRKRTAAIAAATMVLTAAALGGPAAGDDGDNGDDNARATFRVTLVNLTGGQPFSPPVAATHRKSIHLIRVGRLASDELALIAQDGDQLPLFGQLSGSQQVTQAVDVGRPVTAQNTAAADFTDNVTFEITGRAGDRLSLATMLICTNDGFLGLDGVKLPRRGATAYVLNGYDAGRENNTEASDDLVDPCSDLNPGHGLAGDPDGNRDSEVATNPRTPIAHHPGIHGGADLDPAFHDWSDPVAVVVVTRVTPPDESDDD
jgi:hypothetical protein